MTGAVAVVANSKVSGLLSLSSDTAEGIGNTTTILTNFVTASSPVSGATFMWQYEFGDTSLTPSNPSGASTRWAATGMASGEDRTATWRVTASFGGTPFASAIVTVFVSRF